MDTSQMVKLGLGENLVIAKIEQAPTVNFRLDVEDLAKLKSEGVTDPIIETMLRRSTAPAPASSASAPAMTLPFGLGSTQMPAGDVVYLIAKDVGEKPLRSIAGSMSQTYAFVTYLTHSNFSGTKADERTTDRRPSLRLSTDKNPKGRLFLVMAEIDEDDDVRSVKMGNTKAFGSSNMFAPDKDNQIAVEAVEESPNIWRITPKKDLKPGEYGVWSVSQEMYDFGID